jgi:hypothetical protein
VTAYRIDKKRNTDIRHDLNTLSLGEKIKEYQQNYVRFQVLMAASMKIRAFWDIAPCSLGVDRHFRGAYCLHHQGEGGGDDDDGGSTHI